MFLNPIMFAGLAGALVPLVVHLLAKARYRSIDWGAMMFLIGAEARQQQSARLKQIILLLVRMAMVGLLAVALARPVVRGEWGALGQETHLSAVIVLDGSASMGYQENGQRRMQLAREAVLQILSTMQKGDQAALVVMGEGKGMVPASPRRPGESETALGRNGDSPRLTSDLQATAAEVDNVRTGAGQANVAEGLTRAAEILDHQPGLNRRIYLVCDRQALSWSEVNEMFGAAWRKATARTEPPTRLVVIPVGTEEAQNLAVESVALVNPPAIEEQPAEIEVRVRNNGREPRAGVPLTVSAGGASKSVVTSLTMEPKSVQTVRVAMKFAKAGSHVVTAALSSSGLSSDDQRDCAIDVIDPLKVLIVSGDERPGAFHSESDFLRLALMPFKSIKKSAHDLADVEVKPAEKWPEVDLRRYQVVILANVAQFTDAQARALELFVYGGGGLLIAPGNVSRVENYNQMLWRDGNGILPAALSAATAADGSQATTLLGLRLHHPVFQFLQGRPDPVPAATIGRYFSTQERDSTSKLAEYASGKPFLLESRAGRGRVLLVTTALDRDWSTLPLSSFYLPFVQSAVRYLSGGAIADRNLVPGQPIQMTFGERAEIQGTSMRLPGGETQALEVQRLGDRSEIRYVNTDQPGTYTVRLRSAGPEQQVWHFVVQTPGTESDLTPLTSAQWQRLSEEVGFELVEPRGRPIATMIRTQRAGREMWLGLLGAVLSLAMVEMFLARSRPEDR